MFWCCPQIQKPPSGSWRCQARNIPDIFVVGVHNLKIYILNLLSESLCGASFAILKTPNLNKLPVHGLFCQSMTNIRKCSSRWVVKKLNCRIYLNYNNCYHSTDNKEKKQHDAFICSNLSKGGARLVPVRKLIFYFLFFILDRVWKA